MINKIVIFMPTGTQLTLLKPKSYHYFEFKLLEVVTSDGFKYVSTLPFVVEEKIEKEKENE